MDNTFFNLPDLDELGLENALFDSPFFAYLGALLFTLGAAAFGFLVPALAGYIAYAIADRPGIAPGFVMGAIAGTLNSGFLGGIVGGVLAGIVAHWITGWKVPTWMRGLMPVLVIPLLATLISGFVMLVVLGKPLAALMEALSDGLNSLQGGSAIILGIILGLMMAFDMGGPLNKTAYAFAATGLGAAATATDAPELKVMAAVMLAGMVPPLALALATVVRPGALHHSRARERQGCLGDGSLLHHRRCHPVRRGRPAARDPVDHGRQRGHRRTVDGPGRVACGPRTAASSCCSPSTASWASSSPSWRARWSRRPWSSSPKSSARPTPTSLPSDRITSTTPHKGAFMPSKSVVVGSAVGLHARPAAIIAEKAGELGSEVTINGVDASSSLMIMTLGAGNGDTVEVAGDDQAAVDAIAALVEQDLDA